jgi:GMP synthase (glutamine-hydrolysing)
MHTVPVFRHVPHETLGTIGTALERAGLAAQYVDLFAQPPLRLDLRGAPGLVVLGGPMNVDETDKYPFLGREVEWIRTAVDAGVPVLAICLGAQLLAKSLGAKVFSNGIKEIGWYSVDLTPQAVGDALLGTVAKELARSTSPGRVTVFQWHGDTFDLPAGAVHLAHSEACRHQAFRYGDSAYALQFHLEVTAEMIDDWLNEKGNCDELAALDYIDPQAIRRRTPQEIPAMQTLGATVFGHFAALCAQRAERP